MRIAFKLDLVALSCLQLALVLGATMDVASASAVAGWARGFVGERSPVSVDNQSSQRTELASAYRSKYCSFV